MEKPFFFHKPNKKRGAAFAVVSALAALLFCLFVPVSLQGSYDGPAYAFRALEKERVSVVARTFSGKEYPVDRFIPGSDTVKEGSEKIAIQKGLLRGYITLEPVSFVRYRLTLNAPLYEGEPVNAACFTAEALYEDGMRFSIDPEEFVLQQIPAKSSKKVHLVLSGPCGEEDVGEWPVTAFAGYKTEYEAFREGDPVSEEDVRIWETFADGIKRPAEGKLNFSETIAKSTTQLFFEGRFGSLVEPLSYLPLTGVKILNEKSFSVVYSDGESRTLPMPARETKNTPLLSSCRYQNGALQLEISSDEKADLVYGVYYINADGTAGECVGAGYGCGEFSFSVPFSTRMLRSPVAVRAMAEGAALSNAMYLTNPEALAQTEFAYPVQPSKKGLQVETGLMGDVKALGVRHAAINVILNSLLGSGIRYSYDGTVYSFNSAYVRELDSKFSALARQGITTSAILLMGGGGGNLIYPGGRTGGHKYYGLNMRDEAAKKRLAAIFTFLAERYSNENYLVLNWILGNEVANYREWNYCGTIGLEEYVQNYADSLRLLHNCTRSVFGQNHSLISLDNCWNFERNGCFTSRQMLDGVAEALKKQGDIEWWTAYHSYSEPLTDPSFWTHGARVRQNIDSKMISMINLHILTDYVKNTYGEGHKFILSEMGYSSSAEGETVQAAALAYAYFLAEQNDMVESMIVHRHRDHGAETSVGLYLGLLNGGGGRKKAWYVFKDMDTDPPCADFALDVIGAESWEQLLTLPPEEAEEQK